jgi:hypothetical protein
VDYGDGRKARALPTVPRDQSIEHFPEKLIDFSVKKMRHNKELEKNCDSDKSQFALLAPISIGTQRGERPLPGERGAGGSGGHGALAGRWMVFPLLYPASPEPDSAGNDGDLDRS